MMHQTVGVVGSPGRTWTQGVDGGAWGPQVKSPISPERLLKPVNVSKTAVRLSLVGNPN